MCVFNVLENHMTDRIIIITIWKLRHREVTQVVQEALVEGMGLSSH